MLPTLRRSTYPKICHILPVNIVSSSEQLHNPEHSFMCWLLFLYLKFKGDDDMAKRKKPSSFAQLVTVRYRFLGKNRRNPYGVTRQLKKNTKTGNEATESNMLCFWMIGFAVLTAYKPAPILPAWK